MLKVVVLVAQAVYTIPLDGWLPKVLFLSAGGGAPGRPARAGLWPSVFRLVHGQVEVLLHLPSELLFPSCEDTSPVRSGPTRMTCSTVIIPKGPASECSDVEG